MRIFLTILIMFLGFPALAEDNHKPQLYDYYGSPVDPLCFLSNHGTEDNPVYPTVDCELEEIVNVGNSPLDERFVAVSYEEEHCDPEVGDGCFSTYGLIGYRAIGMVEYQGHDLMALWLVENGGGSGTFHTLMLVEPVRDEEAGILTYRRIETLVVGDRCMGGIASAQIDPENKDLIYRVNTTMADMFLLVGDAEREVLTYDTYADLPFCAICCYAEAEYSLEEFRGLEFTSARYESFEDIDESEECVENLVALNVKNGHSYFGKEEFGIFIRELEHVCLGRMEGE